MTKIHGIFLACLFTITAQAAEPTLVYREGMVDHPSLRKTQQDFLNYTKSYKTPELFDNNEVALQARLKLLDQVPAGGKAKIMTFVYDNGYATRLLATHLCLAAKRGVDVEILPDSKSGDRPGVLDAFDTKGDAQMNEEVYQLLANCGVKVRVHNHIEEFDVLKIKGMPIPKLPSNYVSLLTTTGGQLWAFNKLKGDFTTLVEEHFNAYFDTDQAKEDFKDVKKAVNSLMKSVAISYIKADSPEEKAQAIIDALNELKQIVLETDSLKKLETARPKIFLLRLLVKLQKHERLGEFFKNAHLFNRLNHRKLFWVSSGDQSCMFLGGRNLGDHYLTWGRHGDEFMDGDVMICDHHLGPQDGQPLKEAAASFKQLWDNEDLEDPLGVAPQVTQQRKQLKYKFQYLLLPDYNVQGWGNPMWVFMPFDAQKSQWQVIDWRLSQSIGYEDIKEEGRLMPFPMLWESNERISGRPLEDAYGWHVQTTTWMRKRDMVRKELYDAIDRETENAYIETAYSSMSTKMRDHVEDALKRGVKVQLVTNSIFVSDGGSKAIRLLMANWTSQMLKKYPALFSAKFATLEYGHMIHFKGASFKCQKDSTGVYRYNLIGSHNFHDRSGYSDKEHALFWKQIPQESCAKKNNSPRVSDKPDLKDYRDRFYGETIARAGALKPLKAYHTLEAEFQDALNTGKLSDLQKKLVEWSMVVLYDHKRQTDGSLLLIRDSLGNAVLRQENHFVEVLESVSETGLSDILGSLL